MATRKQYVVTAPYVTIKTATQQGPRLLGFYLGAPVPADAPDEQIGYLLRDGLIEEVKAEEAPKPPAAQKPPDPPKPPAGPQKPAGPAKP